jgi:hypothetical protein
MVDTDAVGNIHTELEIKNFQTVYRETFETEEVMPIELASQATVEAPVEAPVEATEDLMAEVRLDLVSDENEKFHLTPAKRYSMMSVRTNCCSAMSPQLSNDSMINSSLLKNSCLGENFELNRRSKSISKSAKFDKTSFLKKK